ncbi:unnamed protein product, partial [Prunus brigantina]
ICNDEEESVEHMLLLCPWVEPGERNCVLDHIALTSWTIRKIRNRAVFDNYNPHPQRALKSISDQVNKRLLLKHKITHPTLGNNRQTSQVRWIAPPASLAKINVDAAWHQGSCRAGVGIIIHNSEGSFRGAKSVSFHAEIAWDAEAIALLEGCKFARERNLTKVCFEFDSLELIKCVKGNIGREMEPVSCPYPHRIDNQAADNLASLALSRRSTEVWVERPPPPPPTSLVPILNKDGLPCPYLS